MLYKRTDEPGVLMLRIGNIWHYLDEKGNSEGEYNEHNPHFENMLLTGVFIPMERVHLAVNMKTGELTYYSDGTTVPEDCRPLIMPMGIYA